MKLVALFVSLLTYNAVFSQSGSYQFDAIDSRKGLSNNQVNYIYKDERGFVWLGTVAGLNRYDGYNFKVFRHKIGDSTSINDNNVTRIVQGPHDKLWVFTPYGWNIFDPLTEKFTTNLNGIIDTAGIGDENVTTIVQDKAGNFWFVSPGKGLYKYTAATKKTAAYRQGSKGLPLYANSLNAAVVDNAGYLWIVYGDGVLEKIDPSRNEIVYRSYLLKSYTPKATVRYRLFADKDNDIWIFPKGEERGLFYFRPAQNLVRHIHKDAEGPRVNNNLINAVTQDEKGLIWIGTDHGGINLLNKLDFSIKPIVHNDMDPHSLSENSVTALHKDKSGIVWIGTNKKGINKFHEANVRFPLYQHQQGNPNSLMYNDINKFVEDKHGNLWIGTNGGGLIYFNRTTGTFKQYLHTSDPNSLSNNIIVSMLIDHQGKLWIGTYFGGLDCFDGTGFIHYRHDEANPASLADNRVWEIFEDSKQRLWIGTLMEGLDLFDRKSGSFVHYKSGKTGNTLPSNYVCSVMEDRSGNIWIGTSSGVAVLDEETNSFRHFEHIEGDKNSLSHNGVTELLQDSRGLIWIATRDGLNIYDPAKKRFKTFRMDDGLADHSILTIIEDNNKDIWATTPNGVSHITLTRNNKNELTLRVKNYDETDGLQGRQFNENAICKTSAGEIVVGGANGFNIFHPSRPVDSKPPSKLILTDLQIFNNSVGIGEKYDGKVVLPKSITETKELTLEYDQNVFTIEFSALDFLNADKIRYAYKLKGFSKEWLVTDAKARKATFTNLNPGTYQLLIRASKGDDKWGEPLSLTIHVLPPWWLTTYAFMVYVLLAAGAIFFGRRLIVQRAKNRFALEQERGEAQRLHELDMMKIKFFTNVSHEFRTPLSLILSPAEKLLKGSSESHDKTQFQLIYRNARRLLNLVNQLLDFRKMEEQELRLNRTAGDIIHFIKEIAASFSDLAENKKIAFSVHSGEDFVFTSFDHDKLERILFNLLSNSFKFTPAGGAVKVLIGITSSQVERALQLKVIDTGIGIDKDKQQKIFERFFQSEVPGSMVNQGSGIGLAITREFVRMHGGSITVESQPDKGSCFTVTLPLMPIAIEGREQKEGKDAEAEGGAVQQSALVPVFKPQEEKPLKGKKKTVLLVEDNDDFRFYIKDNLKAYYHIIEAQNGKAGWQKTLSEHPDLIVCDISMPEMNGIELCQKIKADTRTSFIPVLLLTALTGEEQQLAGLQTGANDYMTKPFNFEILLSKIKNLLLQQESFKKTYQKQVQAKPAALAPIESADEKFMQQVLAVIEKNMSNPEFSVEELSKQVFMDRVALYRRLFALSGKPPVEFIRSLRIERAAQLLVRGDLTIAEVAYEVGFNNPKYFSRVFKQQFDMLPSTYQAERTNNNSSSD
ncbi:MAG TPA: two-component regulator propeller domain-containing protein [Flavisolibacter sp.]|nr:two-component regulator propeller domain-containing protein [Flavisolibacter sp.]